MSKYDGNIVTMMENSNYLYLPSITNKLSSKWVQLGCVDKMSRPSRGYSEMSLEKTIKNQNFEKKEVTTFLDFEMIWGDCLHLASRRFLQCIFGPP